MLLYLLVLKYNRQGIPLAIKYVLKPHWQWLSPTPITSTSTVSAAARWLRAAARSGQVEVVKWALVNARPCLYVVPGAFNDTIKAWVSGSCPTCSAFGVVCHIYQWSMRKMNMHFYAHRDVSGKSSTLNYKYVVRIRIISCPGNLGVNKPSKEFFSPSAPLALCTSTHTVTLHWAPTHHVPLGLQLWMPVKAPTLGA